VKIQLLPSSFDGNGLASPEQRLTCFLINDSVAIDAGSLAIGITPEQRNSVRDILVTHPHMDHIASLPIFIDDLFSSLETPVRIHATEAVIAALERDVFNWTVYPRFSELHNEFGPVMEYIQVELNSEFRVGDLRVTAIPVNHIVPTVGLIISDGKTNIAFSSDTAETEEFWKAVNAREKIDVLIIETSFPNSMTELAVASRHLTPESMRRELGKFKHKADILSVHLKPSYRELLVEEIEGLGIEGLKVMVPGVVYEW